MQPNSQIISREDCLLVVVDAQEKLMPVITANQRISANLARLVQFAGIVDLPVLFTEQQKLGATLEPLSSAIKQPRMISKITFDCFATPEFVEAVEKTGKKTILLTGVESHICVLQTALTALKDFNVHAISDAMGSRDPANWLVAVERMRKAGAVVSSTEMAIYEILGKAGTDEFRKVLPLVK